MSDLATKHCKPCEGGVEPLGLEAARKLIADLDHWSLDPSGKEIEKLFNFRNYHETMAFVNAVAFVAHRANHHPDLSVRYDRCAVRYSTHDAGGVTANDCICAALVERMNG